MKELILNAAKTLHLGQVVAHPTETCYGLAVDIFQNEAMNRLYFLKKMPLIKPVSILVRDLEEAQQYGAFSTLAVQFALKYWPGALTIVVPRKNSLPKYVNFGKHTVGFRVSNNKKTKQLLEAFGGPITTTSANLSGEPHAYNVQEFLDQGLVPDFVLDSGQIFITPPSTIVKVVGDEFEVLRQGPIAL